jgi:predicted DNA-binding transcriptional regulator AlpA
MARFIRPAEIREKYGISKNFFYKLVKKGFLKRRLVGRKRRGIYLDEDVEKALQIK